MVYTILKVINCRQNLKKKKIRYCLEHSERQVSKYLQLIYSSKMVFKILGPACKQGEATRILLVPATRNNMLQPSESSQIILIVSLEMNISLEH